MKNINKNILKEIAATGKAYGTLKAALLADYFSDLEKTKFYIQNGYSKSWAAENQNASDEGLKRNATATRWQQYQDGTISREKCIEYTYSRYERQKKEKLLKECKRLELVAAAEDVQYINIYIDWRRSQTWGHNPHVTAIINGKTYEGSASGCGYDKRSAATAEAFNKCNSMLKMLYDAKEKALHNGVEDNNRNILGYGSGYSTLPYFEGGVGFECHASIIKDLGYNYTASGTDTKDFYTFTKIMEA